MKIVQAVIILQIQPVFSPRYVSIIVADEIVQQRGVEMTRGHGATHCFCVCSDFLLQPVFTGQSAAEIPHVSSAPMPIYQLL